MLGGLGVGAAEGTATTPLRPRNGRVDTGPASPTGTAGQRAVDRPDLSHRRLTVTV
jgi:hypothetical protein